MIVLSVGGSILNPGNPDIDFIKKLSQMFIKQHGKEGIAIVTGGGTPARIYANAIRTLGGSESTSDITAIYSTKQNAMLLIVSLGKHAWPSVPSTFEEAAQGVNSGKIVVMGGTVPGITTDTDAAILAEMIGARKIINISNVDALYNKDPRKSADAKRISRITFNDLIGLATKGDRRVAGENFIFDLFACKIIARSKIETHFVGPDLKNIGKALNGCKHNGTVVKG